VTKGSMASPKEKSPRDRSTSKDRSPSLEKKENGKPKGLRKSSNDSKH
jgi:hypothetical protein